MDAPAPPALMNCRKCSYGVYGMRLHVDFYSAINGVTVCSPFTGAFAPRSTFGVCSALATSVAACFLSLQTAAAQRQTVSAIACIHCHPLMKEMACSVTASEDRLTYHTNSSYTRGYALYNTLFATFA